MKTKTSEPQPAEGRIPKAVEVLASTHGLDPRDLLGWSVRRDGTAVILAPDGRKYVSGRDG